MVTLDKPSPHDTGLVRRIMSNLKFSCKRDYLRKRFVIRWCVIFFVLFLVLQYLAKSRFKVDFRFGEHHDHDKIVEFKKSDHVAIMERDAQEQMLQNLGGLHPPNKDNFEVNDYDKGDPIQQPQQRQQIKEPPKKEAEKVHAFVGDTKLTPLYLDFIDVNQPWDKKAEEDSKTKWKLNKYLSDRTPLNRNTVDGRHETCRTREYPRELPAASIVLVFYNEALSVILRTAFTVLKESNPSLIHEILLYDDGSTNDELFEPLERHIANYPKIRLVRTKDRGGLVKARLYSSREARGEVLLYLDAHCEPTPGWLEPLLEPIAKDRTTVTVPSLDAINWGNLEYSGADTIYVIGGVNWLMNMLWAPIPEREKQRRQKEDPYPITANLKTASMAGGLFAMDRLYFKELGEYDEGMGVWGGENMELSFRIWMCGGSMLFIPCSKVGHIFRASHPYDFMGSNSDVVSTNYVRVARVWFDDELEFFYKLRPQFRNLDVGDLSERFALREKLKCKSYAWFIKNIYPELPIEKDLIASGQFKTDDNKCMDTRGGDLQSNNPLHLGQCHTGAGPNEASNRFMMLTKDNRLMGLNFCCDSGFSEELKFVNCHMQGGAQAFHYDPATRTIKQGESKCVTGDPQKQLIIMADCQSGNLNQLWNFEYNYQN